MSYISTNDLHKFYNIMGDCESSWDLRTEQRTYSTDDMRDKILELATLIDTQSQHTCQVDPLKERVRELESRLSTILGITQLP